MNVLGIAYRENGTVAARFSDTIKLAYQKKKLKDFAIGLFDYENTFNIAPGTYTLKLVLSAGGEKFGKYVFPMVVDPFTGSELSLGGPALGEPLYACLPGHYHHGHGPDGRPHSAGVQGHATGPLHHLSIRQERRSPWFTWRYSIPR